MQPQDYSMPILEISDFLNRHSPDETMLTNRQHRMLALGIQLLERASKGYDIVNTRRLIPDLDSLNAYSFAIKAALATDPNLRKNREKSRRLFEHSVEILKQIKNGVPIINLNQEYLKETRELFDQLSSLAFSNADISTEQINGAVIFSRVIPS